MDVFREALAAARDRLGLARWLELNPHEQTVLIYEAMKRIDRELLTPTDQDRSRGKLQSELLSSAALSPDRLRTHSEDLRARAAAAENPKVAQALRKLAEELDRLAAL